ncbi:50S ribosomal protein L23 [candidate division WOR-3 bacterium]|nr:50S ribosomal protein L23 [candidate division WOR-3 bacterium]MCK4585065.1 50S ribosomal protein L23 [candidate division WOR-3 bacterium]
MDKDPRSIIISPIRTEKTEDILASGQNKYYFKVAINANKIEIRKAAEELFKVKVIKCDTIKVKGKRKSWGRKSGKRPDWKKAILTLKEGDKITIFEGA